MKTIRLPCYDIVIELFPCDHSGAEPGDMDGTITSSLKVSLTPDGDDTDEKLLAAMDAIESLILAHACAGIDVESNDYIYGIETAVDAAFNNLG